MYLYHASEIKIRTLKPPKFTNNINDHQNYVWFSTDQDYCIFMVIFRKLDDLYPDQLRFYMSGSKALFYPDKFGPLYKNKVLFNKLFQKANPFKSDNIKPIWVHQVNKSKYNFKKSDWGDYFTSENISVDNSTRFDDPLSYLNSKFEVKILVD